MNNQFTRRRFLKQTGTVAAAAAFAPCIPLSSPLWGAEDTPGSKMKLGMVTYLWGKDWDLPTLIANCERAGLGGVETRVDHKHGVGPALTASERLEVKKMFADSPVELLGPGTNECFDSPDPDRVRQCIENAKAFLKLSHDCGGTGVKVKPNSLHDGVPQEVTTAQIAKSLDEVGTYAGEYGQKVRVEVHGSCCPLPIMKEIIDQVESPHVGLCWNCNGQDLDGKGLEHNFNLVKDRFADTVHIRELNSGDYPYQELMNLFVGMDYEGWILFENRTSPPDLVEAYIEQRELFETMVAEAMEKGV